jgi:hypothetical protein
MANSILGNPWVLDTASSGPVTTAPVYVKSLRWVAPGASSGNLLELVSAASSGDRLWESVANGPNYVEAEQIEMMWPKGFAVPVLASGRLYLTLWQRDGQFVV